MKTELYIKIGAKRAHCDRKKWVANSFEARKNKPSTGPNEVAIKLEIEIPDAYFEVPELSAKITVPKDSVNKPIITPEVEHNISQALSQQLGLKVHVAAVEEVAL